MADAGHRGGAPRRRGGDRARRPFRAARRALGQRRSGGIGDHAARGPARRSRLAGAVARNERDGAIGASGAKRPAAKYQPRARSEEHTSELQSLMRISYAVFCLKKKKEENNYRTRTN